MFEIVTMWQKKRDVLNHDVLGIEYLNGLRAFIERLRRPDPNAFRIAEFIDEDFPMWEECQKEAEWLLNNFEKEMSPQVFLEYQPLSRCDDGTQEWLGGLIHQLWLTRYNPDDSVETCRKALHKADETYREIIAGIPESTIHVVPSLVMLLDLFETFTKACANFSSELSKLPREVLLA